MNSINVCQGIRVSVKDSVTADRGAEHREHSKLSLIILLHGCV